MNLKVEIVIHESELKHLLDKPIHDASMVDFDKAARSYVKTKFGKLADYGILRELKHTKAGHEVRVLIYLNK